MKKYKYIGTFDKTYICFERKLAYSPIILFMLQVNSGIERT